MGMEIWGIDDLFRPNVNHHRDSLFITLAMSSD